MSALASKCYCASMRISGHLQGFPNPAFGGEQSAGWAKVRSHPRYLSIDKQRSLLPAPDEACIVAAIASCSSGDDINLARHLWRYIGQGTPLWHKLRPKVLITGSSAWRRLGFGDIANPSYKDKDYMGHLGIGSNGPYSYLAGTPESEQSIS